MEPVGIEYQNVQKRYQSGGEELSVLAGVTFSVKPGEYVALMGPSGSGKSTLLNLTGGLDRPTSGRITVGKFDPGAMTEDELCHWRNTQVGFIFQRYHLLEVLTAAENVEVPLLLLSLPKSERRRRVTTALELVGLPDRAGHYPRQLSGGQEQRVAIARAIVTDPALLLADEPTGDLDTASAESILKLLDLLNKELKKTIVMVTHDANAARRANRTLHLHKGTFSERGPVAASA